MSDRRAHRRKHVLIYLSPVSEEIISADTRNVVPGIKPAAIFGENYARLQELKKKYDPDLMFFKWNPITPQA